MTTEHTSRAASPDVDLDLFERQGWVVVPNVLNASELARVRLVLDRLIRGAGVVAAPDDVFDLEPDHSLGTPRVRRIKEPSIVDPVFAELVRHPIVLDVVESLIGQDIRYQAGKLNMKAGGGGSAVEWHQDAAFYPHTNDDLVAVGLALEDADETNGCLLVVPGSHRGPVLDHHQDGVFVGAIRGDHPVVVHGPVVPVPVPAGGISVHHVRLLHGSAPNSSSRSRPLLLQQYAAADAFPLVYPSVRQPDLDELAGAIVRGEPALTARRDGGDTPMPCFSWDTSTIYESQQRLERRAFPASAPAAVKP